MEILVNLKLNSEEEKISANVFLDVKTRWVSLEEMTDIFLKNYKWGKIALCRLKETNEFSSK